jgi:hypothetical protein
MTQIRDMLYVKWAEKRLRRPLNEEELNGEPFRAVFPNGQVEFLQVPYLAFPYDLLTKPEDFYVGELSDIKDAA